MSKETGGPAFPSATERDQTGRVLASGYVGMTLRDYIAIKAMAADLNDAGISMRPQDKAKLAEHAYAMADAMLAHRNREAGDE